MLIQDKRPRLFDENGDYSTRLYTEPLTAVIVAMAVDVIKSCARL